MPEIVERNGTCYEIEYGPGCENCQARRRPAASEGGGAVMALVESCIRCGKGRWVGLAPTCAQCRDAYADEVRQAAMRLTTEYLANPEITLAELGPDFVALIEALDGISDSGRSFRLSEQEVKS